MQCLKNIMQCLKTLCLQCLKQCNAMSENIMLPIGHFTLRCEYLV